MAGIAAPNPSGPGVPELIPIGGGWLGPLAGAQYRAMFRLRWEMFRSGLRSIHGILDLGATGITWLIYAALGLGFGTGMGIGTYFLVSDKEWKLIPILFWVLCFLWQMIPVMVASYQEQFNLGMLLRFPVSFGSYYALYVVFGLLDISTVLGGVCCIAMWIGVAVARPDLLLWTTFALAVFAAFNILLVRAIFAWIERWLAQRKTREILGAIFMVAILAAQLLNPALYQKKHTGHRDSQHQVDQMREVKARYAPALKTANAIQAWLPPGLAANALQQAVADQPGPGFVALGTLGLYGILVGAALGLRLKAEYRGENLSVAPSRAKSAAARSKAAQSSAAAPVSVASASAIPDRFGPIVAIMEKDLRALMRTLPLLYAIGAPLLLVLVFSTMFVKNGPIQGPVFPFALPICMVYAQLGFTQLFYNSLGTEGAGVQIYFLSPTPFRTVLLAKNLLHILLFFAVAIVAGVLSVLRLGAPDPAIAAGTAAWLLFALPCNLTAGNIFSIKMPYRVNPGRISRQRGSQASALLSLLVQLCFLAVGALVFAIAWFTHKMWLAPLVFLVLAAAAAFVWQQMLKNSDALANDRRDELMATLMKES